SMQDRPAYNELLAAVQHFLETDVVPALEGPKKFHARVAANILAIVQRELHSAHSQLRAEWDRLDTLLGPEAAPNDDPALRAQLRARTEELCERIRRGDADDPSWGPTLIAHVRQTVIDKLAVANPKYLGAELTKAVGMERA